MSHITGQVHSPNAPACASINDVPTGVPSQRSRSSAACADKPWPHALPAARTHLPARRQKHLKCFKFKLDFLKVLAIIAESCNVS